MATEVTKLISVSLGKMHQSRQTKCGLNLRRSLLVASVLHKARDAYVSEIKNRRVDCQKSSEEAAPAPEPVRKRRFTSQRSMVDSTSDQNSNITSTTSSECENSEDKTEAVESKRTKTEAVTSTEPATSNLKESQSQAKVADNVLDILASDSDDSTKSNLDKENSPPDNKSEISVKQDRSNSQSQSSCGRCLKRRLSHNDSQSTETSLSNGAITGEATSNSSSRNNQDTPSAKRSRPDISSSSDNNSLLSAITSDSTTQINNLVRIFSQSFPELTATEEQESSLLSSSGCDTKPSELNTFAIHLRESIVLTA